MREEGFEPSQALSYQVFQRVAGTRRTPEPGPVDHCGTPSQNASSENSGLFLKVSVRDVEIDRKGGHVLGFLGGERSARRIAPMNFSLSRSLTHAPHA